MPHTLEPRVTHLEASVTSLTVTVNRLASTVEKVNENLAGSIERSEVNLRDDIRRLAAEQAESRSTNWGWVIAGVVATSVIVGAIGKGYVDPVSASQTAIRQQATENAQDLRDLSHEVIPAMRERLARIEQRQEARP